MEAIKAFFDTSPYFFLTSHFITALLSSLTLVYSAKGFYYQLKASKCIGVSLMVQFYFIYNFLLSIFSSIFHIYMVILWRPNTNIYNAYFMYFTSAIFSMLLVLNIVIELFLCIDRCLSVLNGKYSEKQGLFVVVLTIAAWFAALFLITYGNNFIQNIPRSSSTKCRSIYCLVRLVTYPAGYYIRLALALCNLVSGIFLHIVIKFRLNNLSAHKKVNKTAVYIVLLTVFFDFTPSLLCQIYFMVKFKSY